MPRPQKLPGADTSIQWFQDDYPGATMNADGGVLHTTEGTDWPDYSGGAVAPNATAKPDFKRKRLEWRQHFPVDKSSRALQNRVGGVQTNTFDVFQVELVGTCNPPHATKWGTLRHGVDYLFWPDAPDWALASLAAMLAWLDAQHGIPATSPVHGRWTPYPKSYGAGGQRFTNNQWSHLKGWVGHQHVPENDHGDPGALDFPAVAAAAAVILHPPKPVPPLEELLEMKLSDTVTIPGTYLQNPTDKPQEVTVEVLLRRIAEWSYVSAYGQVKAKK